jgi:hypothetical protein
MQIAMSRRYSCVSFWIHETDYVVILERIRYPVRDEARDTPLSQMARDRVKISVCPVQCQLHPQ